MSSFSLYSAGLISPFSVINEQGEFVLPSESDDILASFKKVSALKPSVLRRNDRITKKAIYALESALAASLVALDALPRDRIAMILGTGLGTLETSLSCLDKIFDNGDKYCSPMSFMNSVHNSVAANLSQLFDFQGQNITLSGGSLSFEYAYQQAEYLLASQQADCVIVGAIEEVSEALTSARKHVQDNKLLCSDFKGEDVESAFFALIGPEESAAELQCRTLSVEELKELSPETTLLSGLGEEDLLQLESISGCSLISKQRASSFGADYTTPVSGSLLFAEAVKRVKAGSAGSVLLVNRDSAQGSFSLIQVAPSPRRGE